MRMADVLAGAAACVGAALLGCGSGASSGSGGSSAAASSGAGGSSATSASSSTASNSSGASTSSSGMDPGAFCNSCVGGVFIMDVTCKSHLDACQADLTCSDWLACTSACRLNNPTAACFADCDSAAASAASLYKPIYDCICAASACQTECSFACP